MIFNDISSSIVNCFKAKNLLGAEIVDAIKDRTVFSHVELFQTLLKALQKSLYYKAVW